MQNSDLSYIGVTERGDAGIDFSWHGRLGQPQWAGAVLITKRLSERFIELALTATKPVIVHCTCTGNGGTWAEPNVPDYREQLEMLQRLIDCGFPAERTVLRVDPIIPTPGGLDNARRVLHHVLRKQIPVTRVRFSVLDQYPHVVQRLQAMGKQPFYPAVNGRCPFYAPKGQLEAVADMLAQFPFRYESCAEDWAARIHPDKITVRGCVSQLDLDLMGLKAPDVLRTNMQGRNGCHCLSCKRELLTTRKPCPNKCVYCYWKD